MPMGHHGNGTSLGAFAVSCGSQCCLVPCKYRLFGWESPVRGWGALHSGWGLCLHVCPCTYARKHACTPETWPVEAPVKVSCSHDWGTQPTFRGLFQGQAELVSLAMVTLPTWSPQPCLSSLCVDIQNELGGLSRGPGRTCHCSSLLGSHCLQEALPDIPLAGSAEGPGTEAHQSEVSCDTSGSLLTLTEPLFLPVQWRQAWQPPRYPLGPGGVLLRPAVT